MSSHHQSTQRIIVPGTRSIPKSSSNMVLIDINHDQESSAASPSYEGWNAHNLYELKIVLDLCGTIIRSVRRRRRYSMTAKSDVSLCSLINPVMELQIAVRAANAITTGHDRDVPPEPAASSRTEIVRVLRYCGQGTM